MATNPIGRNRKKPAIILLIIFILLSIAGFWGWNNFYLSKEAEKENVNTPSVVTNASGKLPAYYVILPRPFIFNVTGDNRDRLVQVKVQLMVRGDLNESTANQHIPLVESNLLQTFSAASVEELRTPNGRIELRKKALAAIQDALIKVSGRETVEQVLFTGFVMQ